MRDAPARPCRKAAAPPVPHPMASPHSCALPEWLDLLASDKVFEGALTAGLPLAVPVLERHHCLTVAPDVARTLRAAPRAPAATGDRAGAVQIGVEREGRIHHGPVPSRRRGNCRHPLRSGLGLLGLL